MKKESEKGFIAAIACAGIWGILPVYWKSLIPISSSVIIIYRILMVCLMSFIVAKLSYSWKRIFSPLRDYKVALKYGISGLIITLNWGIYIWAVNAGHVLQTSIGYYIEPLAVCIFGVVFFREKLSKYKTIAISLAAVSVFVILIHFGQVPGIALMIAFSFAIYSAIKKTVQQPPILSLLYETIFLSPIALAAIVWLEINGRGAIGAGRPYQYFLLLLCGVATAVPLGLFAYAAQRSTMFVLGLTEYLSPTLSLILGVLVFKEDLDHVQFIAFSLIWIGLIFFSYGEFKQFKDDTKEE